MARKPKQSTGPRILNERTELVPIDSVQPWPDNPNQGDLGAIITLMERHGFWGTLLVQKSSNRIVCGNFRWRSAQHLGYKELPVTFIDVPDRQAREILAADNRSNRLGTDDPAAMADFLQRIMADGGDLLNTGWDQGAVDNMLHDLAAPFVAAPEGLQQVGEGAETERVCPRCGYRFSGGQQAPNEAVA